MRTILGRNFMCVPAVEQTSIVIVVVVNSAIVNSILHLLFTNRTRASQVQKKK
eukprot:NODE_10600_length_436_cov_1.558140_g9489_i0.p3 GENE.NODE_10600_length_436_cov_1.558140_g9489_i0~~NODE_10600_length_436_cov_1.558140_g9489_i0.p3  ORF type:complete len:53 (-),score=3.59 NODE_10600_length_436_cov_1.558140_g9489_i0:195-353(-)